MKMQLSCFLYQNKKIEIKYVLLVFKIIFGISILDFRFQKQLICIGNIRERVTNLELGKIHMLLIGNPYWG